MEPIEDVRFRRPSDDILVTSFRRLKTNQWGTFHRRPLPTKNETFYLSLRLNVLGTLFKLRPTWDHVKISQGRFIPVLLGMTNVWKWKQTRSKTVPMSDLRQSSFMRPILNVQSKTSVRRTTNVRFWTSYLGPFLSDALLFVIHRAKSYRISYYLMQGIQGQPLYIPTRLSFLDLVLELFDVMKKLSLNAQHSFQFIILIIIIWRHKKAEPKCSTFFQLSIAFQSQFSPVNIEEKGGRFSFTVAHTPYHHWETGDGSARFNV